MASFTNVVRSVCLTSQDRVEVALNCCVSDAVNVVQDLHIAFKSPGRSRISTHTLADDIFDAWLVAQAENLQVTETMVVELERVLLSLVAAAALSAILGVVPTTAEPIARRQTSTASDRLGLTWLGGNSSLPKVLCVCSPLRL